MYSFMSVLLFWAAAFCIDQVYCKPLLKELSIKRSFDFVIKPIPLKPITFIKEKWSPFGNFGVKHGIVKRNVLNEVDNRIPGHEDLNTLPYEVFEHLEDPPLGFVPSSVLPPHIQDVPVHRNQNIMAPVQIPLSIGPLPQSSNGVQITPVHGLPPTESIMRHSSVPPPSLQTNILRPNNMGYNNPLTPINPNIVEPIFSPGHVLNIQPNIPAVNSGPSNENLYTDVSHVVPDNAHHKPITSFNPSVAVVKEEKHPKIVNKQDQDSLLKDTINSKDETSNIFYKGSNLALRMGNVILDILSRFIIHRESDRSSHIPALT